jgi:hypothetical protein
MTQDNRFLVVEFSGEGITMAEWTRDYPGATADIISEPPKKVGKENVHPSLFLLKFGERAALVQAMERLDRVHGPIETLNLDVLRGQWLGRMTVRESQLHSTAAAAIAQFQNHFGSPWSHLEDGIIYMRARLNDAQNGERLIKLMQGYLKEHEVDAQVSVEEISSHDYGVWDDLVQASIGMAP